MDKFVDKLKELGKKRGRDAKFFTTTKKGEIHELRSELLSKEKKIEAVKKIIAAMTVGKDVSSLFTDVINCMQTDNVELKKLVYLYVMNYAKSNPDLAILAVNTFKKDTAHPNPLIRALAVRTMGCIRVERITEYLCEPLRKALKDEDPYVRKTAAVCVAKLYDINPDLVEVQGFLELLQELLSDSNPTVVANAVASLSEIQENSSDQVLELNTSVLQKLLAALNECTEWGQVFILDALATYVPEDKREAENIIERVAPRLKHANTAVVLSAVKIILQYMNSLEDADMEKRLCRKMAPPLVSLLSGVNSSFPEIQYVALRNINLIVQKRPAMLIKEMKVFFCKYDDPIYVKKEKLEIIIQLASERNIEQVLLEFKEYAREVDVEFVRKSVRAIGRCAIKLQRAAERCINVLLELIQTKINYVVQESIIVIKDIFRKYPNRYESVIGTLCENLVSLDEPEAKGAMVWIIGEYAERIDNADELLESFLEAFHDEQAQVQLQLLTAVVKLFLKKPAENRELVQQCLELATQKSDNPDLRDRGFLYWRLLSASPDAAKAVVLAEKPVITDDTHKLQPELLDTLISNLSSLAAIYHKPPEAFVTKKTHSREDDSDEDDTTTDDEEDLGEDYGATDNGDDDPLGLAFGGANVNNNNDNNNNNNNNNAGSASDNGSDLLGLDDLFGSSVAPSPAPAPQRPTLPLLIEAAKNKEAVSFYGELRRGGNGTELALQIHNQTQQAVSTFAIQVNKNTFGLKQGSSSLQFSSVPPGGLGSASLSMDINDGHKSKTTENCHRLQVAVKNTVSGTVMFFTVPVTATIINTDERMSKDQFIPAWQSIPEEIKFTAGSGRVGSHSDVESTFAQIRMHVVAKRRAKPGDLWYYACCFPDGLSKVLVQVMVNGDAYISLKSTDANLVSIVKKAIEQALP
jgi:AP-1 complex subunit beta-1